MTTEQARQYENRPSVMTPAEASAALRLGKNRVYELLASGELRHRRCGRKFLIPRAAIEEYLMGEQ